jgi:hypothetical protein
MYWGNYMYFNNKLQKISLKKSFIWKNEKTKKIFTIIL